MAIISQRQLQDIFAQADATGKKLDRAEIVQALMDRGDVIEGLNAPTAPPRKGFFATVYDSLKQRNQAATGTDSGLLEAFSSGQISADSALGRFTTGQQTGLETAVQMAGQGAGAISDITGSAISLGGRVLSSVTPDSIEKPIVDGAKSAVQSILDTPIGKAGLNALKDGMDAYRSWKQANPRYAADLESVVNIASMLPVGKASQVGTAVLSKTDDIARGLAKPLRESAEASVSKVLNPTTNATKQATQKLAGEIVDRPLSDTLSITRKGMQAKAATAAEEAGRAIDSAGKLAGKTRTSELVDYLQSKKAQFMADGKVINREGINSIDEVSQIFAQYGDDVSNEALRKIRRVFDDEFFQGKKNVAKSAAETSTLNFKKEAADKIRSILADKFPDVAKLNKEYAFWSNLEDVLGKTVARRTGQKGAIKAMATVGGAVAGQGVAGSVAGALAFRTVASLIDSPAWGFVSAKAKNRLANALANNNLSEIGGVLGSIPGLLANSAAQEAISQSSPNQ